jgi:tRNA G10  N-methylase Trm11
MHKTIAILGRQPALGLAELESLYGEDAVFGYSKEATLLSIANEEIDFNRLGGSVRLAKILSKLPSTNWNDIENYLVSYSLEHAGLTGGKLIFGISTFNVNTSVKAILKTATLIKKAIKESGHSVRMVPHKSLSLGSAVVLYNKLTSSKNWELLVVSDGKTAYLAQTTNVQDINAYAARDQARPKRDAKVGMLPPKLAQIILNLASGKIQKLDSSVKSQETKSKKMVLDPFCGTGVLLQEAILMNYDIYGSDIEPRMVEYTVENLKWLATRYPNVKNYQQIEVGDATKHKWYQTERISFVASESFLGHPLSKLPNDEHLSKIIYEANVINHRFLLNIVKQLKPATRLCLALPTWRGRHEFLHLPLLDHLTEMGYTRIRFKNASDKDLIYHRDNQIVGRELLILIKN